MEFLAIKVIPIPAEGAATLPEVGDNYHLFALPAVDSSTEAVTYSLWFYKDATWQQFVYAAATEESEEGD